MFVETWGGKYSTVLHIRTDANGRKDTIQNMQGSWIIEAAEMEFTRYDDVQAIKAFLTVKTDKTRLPYERTARYFPRQSIFIGTVNPDASGEYLRDKTGNRRFLPVSCGWIDIDGLQRDRDQLFAEAVVMYRAGAKPMLSEEGEAAAKIEQEARTMSDAWEEVISTWLETYELGEELLTLELIAGSALNSSASHLKYLDAIRVGTVMKNLGYKKEKKYDKNTKSRRWCWVKEEHDIFAGLI